MALVYYMERYGYCEDCEVMLTAEDMAPDGLCYDCYADRLIDSIDESEVRSFLSMNRSDFISHIRGE